MNRGKPMASFIFIGRLVPTSKVFSRTVATDASSRQKLLETSVTRCYRDRSVRLSTLFVGS